MDLYLCFDCETLAPTPLSNIKKKIFMSGPVIEEEEQKLISGFSTSLLILYYILITI